MQVQDQLEQISEALHCIGALWNGVELSCWRIGTKRRYTKSRQCK